MKTQASMNPVFKWIKEKIPDLILKLLYMKISCVNILRKNFKNAFKPRHFRVREFIQLWDLNGPSISQSLFNIENKYCKNSILGA